jgi:outer membrane protein OmpA-like peptidoglycan-associated protein/tetratricopeptide (TPR) repeat protein
MYKIFLLIFIILLATTIGTAQWYNPDKVSNKLKIQYNAAIQLAQDGKYKEAIFQLEHVIKQNPNYVEAYLSAAGILGEKKDYNESINYYKKALLLDSVYAKPYMLPYSINVAGSGNFAQALTIAQQFKTLPNLNEKSIKSADYRIKCYEFALQFEKDNANKQYDFAPQNLGDSINTFESEYFPSLTIDGKNLVFTRRLNNHNEDFFVANNIKNNQWSKAVPLPGNVNTPQNEGAQNISQDGSILFFTGCNLPNGAGSCDLYYSLKLNNEWTQPIPAGRNINTEFWESQPSLSSDKRTLYFSGRDPMAIGGSDIYVSYMDDKGKWGVPLNLGKTINTVGKESCPFIHADNETLYFTSETHTGYGGDDLFVSRKDVNGKWTTPVNLGYPINTIENEGSLTITANGSTAYYASDRADSKGGLDLYTFTLRKEMQPTQTLWVKGLVMDSITKKPINSTVELYDRATKKLVQKIQSNDSGSFFITLPVGKNYLFNVNRKGYLFYSDGFNLTNANPEFTYTKNIALMPLQKNATIVLNNIFYQTNKFNLQPESAFELDKIVQLLKDNPTLVIEIDGHTDNVGIVKYNLLLSTNRAKEVVKYLVSKGIAAKQLLAKGFGSSKPIADNKTEQGKAKNRRTELKIVNL